MNENKQEESIGSIKKTMVFIALVLGTIGAIGFIIGNGGKKPEDYDKKALKASLEKYEQIKRTDLSTELQNELTLLIKERKDCFSTQGSYSERSATCKRNYVEQIVRLARKEIKSAPMRGLFIRCIRECPIAGNLCNGEQGTREEECIETEARCIEYCLDKFWRGGSFPNGETYIYKKNKKRSSFPLD